MLVASTLWVFVAFQRGSMSVTIYQNERHNGFSWGATFPGERDTWSDRSGDTIYYGGIGSVVLTSAYSWASDWRTGEW